MSALMNLTSSSSLIGSLAAVTPPIFVHDTTWNQSAFDSVGGGRLVNPFEDSPFRGFASSDDSLRRTRHHRERTSRHQTTQSQHDTTQSREQDTEDRDKKRRSLNMPTSQKPRFARLYALAGGRTNSVNIVEVQQNGSIRTTTNTHSPHSVFMVLFWCHIAPRLFQPCGDYNAKQLRPILLRYEESSRYLCMSNTGEIFSRPAKEISLELEDCLFYHEVVHTSDFYYSWKYPRNTDRCRRSANVSDSTTDGGNSGKLSRTCANRWYLGVNRKNALRTVKTDASKLHSNTRFIQRWIHEHQSTLPPGLQAVSGLRSTASTTTSSTKVDRRTPKNSRIPAFSLLSQRRHPTRSSAGNEKRKSTQVGPSPTKATCKNVDPSNLLINLQGRPECDNTRQGSQATDPRSSANTKKKDKSREFPFGSRNLL